MSEEKKAQGASPADKVDPSEVDPSEEGKKAQGASSGGEVDPSEIQSPSEKLEGTPPEGSAVPGAQNPESEQVKKEINPNTE